MRHLPLVLGIAYPAILFGSFYLAVSLDPFAIFDEIYLIATSVALPAVFLSAGVVVLRWAGGRIWVPAVLLLIWVAAMTFAHIWLVAEVSAGV
ncbi:MAG: hypothetical protein AAFR73_08800 [Pseudomonadota bacterium]